MSTVLAYGAAELKESHRRSMLAGLFFATAIHISVVCLYYVLPAGAADPGVGGWAPPMDRDIVWIPLPPVQPGIAEPRNTAPKAAGSENAFPVPVPDEMVDPDQTMATQDELRSLVDPPGTGDGTTEGSGFIPEIPAPEVDEPVTMNLADCQTLPMVVKRVVPAYPELALRAGMNGKVWVKIRLDREGRPVRSEVIRGDEVFQQAALEAAMGFVFTPAIMNGRPVPVWVSIPFTFTISK
jgi:periplasmic protein TonB